MTPCTCLCWRVRPRQAQTHLCTPADATELLISSSCCDPLGFDGNIDSQGELILQESFQVWDPKTLIRKGRDRHLFLFEMSLVFSKEVKDSNGRSKYLYKSKLFVRHRTSKASALLVIKGFTHSSDINSTLCVYFLLDIRTWSYRTCGRRSL